MKPTRRPSIRNRDVLNAQSPHKWWSTRKSAGSAEVRHCHHLLGEVVD